ncbi:MAG: hypothetical protein Q7U75_19100 [Desulfobacterales bacterium]|nr:hypothetical protein [Desulfobacterales bacterium]
MPATSSKSLLPSHVRAVSTHRPQTLLVEELFRTGFLDRDDVRNSVDLETGDPAAIFEWHLFPELFGSDYDAIEKAGIPLLRSEFGTWVGFDSFGSPYDMYVRPQLIMGIFGIDAVYADIQRFRAN